MDHEFLIDDKLVSVKLEKKDKQYYVTFDDEQHHLDIVRVSPHVISLVMEKQSYRIFHAEGKEAGYFYLNGQHFTVKDPADPDAGFERGEEKSQEEMLLVKAPMPGKVIKLCVSEKDKVRKNQTLVIVEAMKMENEIKASLDGAVKKIFAQPGELVDSDKVIIELESGNSG